MANPLSNSPSNREEKEKDVEMGTRANEDNTDKLYEASIRGCVTTLNMLVQDDPLILHRVSLARFRESPLHIAALLGHLDFTRALLGLKPKLAQELDSFNRSPLHLASAEGHGDVVEELVKKNKDVCLSADQEDRIPLHLAALRGREGVIQGLIRAKPETIFVLLHGETVLHLCVRYNHLNALKILLAASVDHEDFLNLKNRQGKTILELSIMLKQFKTRSYLSSVPQIRVDDVNSLMETGFAALENHLSDVRNSGNENNFPQALLKRTSNTQSIQSATAPNTARTTSWTDYLRPRIWSEFLNYKNDWFEETRGNLMVVATLIAAMSFQVATNAPGGFWQADTKKTEGCPQGQGTCKAGTSILAYTAKSSYQIFTACSILSFALSLSMILLLISGVPLKNKIYVGLLVIGMWSTIILVAATYILSISLVQLQDDQFFFVAAISYAGYWVFIIFGIFSFRIIPFCLMLVSKLPPIVVISGYIYSPLKKLMKLMLKLLPLRNSQGSSIVV